LGWEPIKGFTGHIDGNKKRIYNLTIVRSDEDNVGLFATYNATSATNYTPISNVSLENVGIRGRENVGAVVGKLTVNAHTYPTILDNVYVYAHGSGNNDKLSQCFTRC
jgi:hypothetical protein